MNITRLDHITITMENLDQAMDTLRRVYER